jgi:hypothetical protein
MSDEFEEEMRELCEGSTPCKSESTASAVPLVGREETRGLPFEQTIAISDEWQGVDSRVKAICQRMGRGETYTGACRAEGQDTGSMWRVLRRSAANERAYNLARVRLAQHLAEQTIAISDEHAAEEDPVRRAQLRCGQRQWLAGKLDPTTYGDAKTTQVSTTVQIAVALGGLADLTD